MRKEISEDIKKAYASGGMTVNEIEQSIESAVSKVVQNTKDGVVDINELAKEAVTITIEELQLTGEITKELAGAVVNGVINGINKSAKENINSVDMELLKTKYRLQEQKDRFSINLKNAFDGAKEAVSQFSGETKDELEEALIDSKLKSVESLGLMRETIKHSVKVVIEEGEDVQDKVAYIAKEATQNALNAGRLTAEKTKEISELVLLAIIESAQELEKDVEETTKGAVLGVKDGIVHSVEKVKTDFIEAKDDSTEFVEESIKEMIIDINAAEDAFMEAIANTINRVDDGAKAVLQYPINEIKEITSDLKDSVSDTTEVAIDYLKESGSHVAYDAKEKVFELADDAKDEILDLAEKMVKVSKGAFAGMIDGAKKAISDEKKA